MMNDASLWVIVDDGPFYRRLLIKQDGTIRPEWDYPKKDYKGLDHFAAILGKFIPWLFFYKRPEPLKSLAYDDVHDAFDRATARAAGHDFVMSEGPVTAAYEQKKGQG